MGWRSFLQGGAALLCIGGVIYALATNPGVADTQAHLVVMKADATALLRRGGKLASRSEGAKYGSAFLYRQFWDEGWSRALVSDYEAELSSRGWKKRDDATLEYCKDGILARIVPQSGMSNHQGTNSIVMKYDAETIRRCAR